MQSSSMRASACAIACVFVSACGGGGSGSGVNSTPTPAPTQFTNFSGVQTSTPTTVSGITREGAVGIENTGAILQGNVTTPTEGTGSATFTLNGSRQVTALTLTGSQSNVSFNSSNSASESLYLNGQPVATAVYNSTGSNQALFGDPYVLGFNYQTFGVWGSGLVSGQTGKYGAMSVGAKTNVASIPASGSATFRGYAGGIYTNGNVYRFASDAIFDVNFANRSVGFTTNNRTLTDIVTGNTFGISALAITGAMTYAAGSNAFSGNLTATGGTPLIPLSGSGSGVFYGPNANELGGTFFLRGSTTTLIGGFGAKQ